MARKTRGLLRPSSMGAFIAKLIELHMDCCDDSEAAHIILSTSRQSFDIKKLTTHEGEMWITLTNGQQFHIWIKREW